MFNQNFCIKLYQNSQINCAKKLDIYLYFTPFKKTLPTRNTEILNVKHVNTAFAFQCAPSGEIVIYRKEEWMKVFIHETFHSFGLDIDAHSENIIKKDRITSQAKFLKTLKSVYEKKFRKEWL